MSSSNETQDPEDIWSGTVTSLLSNQFEQTRDVPQYFTTLQDDDDDPYTKSMVSRVENCVEIPDYFSTVILEDEDDDPCCISDVNSDRFQNEVGEKLSLIKSLRDKLSTVFSLKVRPYSGIIVGTEVEEEEEKEYEEEDEEEVYQEAEDDDDVNYGQLSTGEWICTHCTYLNQGDARICIMCSKTRPEVLKALESSENNRDKKNSEDTPPDDKSSRKLYDSEGVKKLVRKLLAEGELRSPEEAKIAAVLIIEDFDEDLAIASAQECAELKTARKYLETLINLINENEENKELFHTLVSSGSLSSKRKAALAIQLMNTGVGKELAVSAAQQCDTFDAAITFSSSVCELCNGNFPPNEAFAMLYCEDKFCQDCATQYFTIQIREHMDLNLACPICQKPEHGGTEDMNYINFLQNQLRSLLDEDVIQLLETKIMDIALGQITNFLWCRKCNNGFVVDPEDRKVACNHCKHEICAHCRMEWLPQHESTSCEEFMRWCEDNKTEKATDFINNLLNENGIECPNCNIKFELAKGGCMHFSCPKCNFQFCSGCGQEFIRGALCKIAEGCANKGLHAHHSRRCLYYLRDKSPEDLIQILKEKNIDYSMKSEHTKDNGCAVLLQKEITGNGGKLIDEQCGEDIDQLSGVLCRKHFIEYLVGLINKNLLDPINILETGELEAELKRNKKQVPLKINDDAKYRQDLVQLILKELPLPAM